jgi:Heme exporter protein D (CcmD)
VWGSYGTVVAVMAIELILLRVRRRRAVSAISSGRA